MLAVHMIRSGPDEFELALRLRTISPVDIHIVAANFPRCMAWCGLLPHPATVAKRRKRYGVFGGTLSVYIGDRIGHLEELRAASV